MKILEHNCKTDQVIERDMTETELKKHEKNQEESLARIANEEAKAKAKTALLERLGITADEAALLLS